jgi:hypothetical protein
MSLAASTGFAGDRGAATERREALQALCSGAQDRAACLRESAAAAEEARRGRLGDSDHAATYRENAVARCNALPAADRDACRARIQGEGVTRGSVKEGGIYRELTIRETGSAADANQAPPFPIAPPTAPRRTSGSN